MLSKGALGQADATAKAKSMVDSLTSMGLTAAQIRTILKQPTKAIA
jgi:hypothetical protein